jgi:hypothetical protein
VFKGHLKGVIPQLIEFVQAYCFVTDIDACVESREIDVYPPGVRGYGIKIGTVFQDVGIDGIFESIGISGLIESLVLMGGEIDLEIAPSFWGVDTVAGEEKRENERKGSETGYRHVFDFSD